MMAAIPGKNTRPELAVRKALHARGLRFRLHAKALPGTPDLVLKQWKVVVFVHGCFWHRHACGHWRIPATRSDFWLAKLEANHQRDVRHRYDLAALGWRVIEVWECEIVATG